MATRPTSKANDPGEGGVANVMSLEFDIGADLDKRDGSNKEKPIRIILILCL